MVIGEAPGENEDIKGSAFVGRAGKLLDDILKSIDLDTEKDVLIANIVKCKPPGNRAPVRDEVSACMPYLHKQIELVQPHVIVLLGAVALKHMIPEKGDFAWQMKQETSLRRTSIRAFTSWFSIIRLICSMIRVKRKTCGNMLSSWKFLKETNIV